MHDLHNQNGLVRRQCFIIDFALLLHMSSSFVGLPNQTMRPMTKSPFQFMDLLITNSDCQWLPAPWVSLNDPKLRSQYPSLGYGQTSISISGNNLGSRCKRRRNISSPYCSSFVEELSLFWHRKEHQGAWRLRMSWSRCQSWSSWERCFLLAQGQDSSKWAWNPPLPGERCHIASRRVISMTWLAWGEKLVPKAPCKTSSTSLDLKL